MAALDWSEILRCELAEIDCVRETQELDLLHARLSDAAPAGEGLTRWLIEHCGDDDANTQVGASWLLRARLEALASTQVRLEPKLVAALAARLPAIHESWARQHVCQCLAVLSVPARQARAFGDFLREASDATPKFLRAWGLDGFVRLSWQHPDFAAEAEQRLGAAEQDEAASVRARARNLRREIAKRVRRTARE